MRTLKKLLSIRPFDLLSTSTFSLPVSLSLSLSLLHCKSIIQLLVIFSNAFSIAFSSPSPSQTTIDAFCYFLGKQKLEPPVPSEATHRLSLSLSLSLSLFTCKLPFNTVSAFWALFSSAQRLHVSSLVSLSFSLFHTNAQTPEPITRYSHEHAMMSNFRSTQENKKGRIRLCGN
jgi:hypothetical protein